MRVRQFNVKAGIRKSIEQAMAVFDPSQSALQPSLTVQDDVEFVSIGVLARWEVQDVHQISYTF